MSRQDHRSLSALPFAATKDGHCFICQASAQRFQLLLHWFLHLFLFLRLTTGPGATCHRAAHLERICTALAHSAEQRPQGLHHTQVLRLAMRGVNFPRLGPERFLLLQGSQGLGQAQRPGQGHRLGQRQQRLGQSFGVVFQAQQILATQQHQGADHKVTEGKTLWISKDHVPELCAGLQCKAAARAEGLTQACGHEDHQPLVVQDLHQSRIIDLQQVMHPSSTEGPGGLIIPSLHLC
mmetsp:Transcript_78356/g.123409  ORF Transcript_78356/g.123409 Transcript_78356/m.123409 type:complete len:237 (-) Transcript_78356:1006-1716(-)